MAKTYRIVLGKNGFSPGQLTIHTGDTIVFSTTEKKAFWPASNPHPTHTIYPAFDSKKPLFVNQTWRFAFVKAGIWHFHDHLEPYFTGSITVLDEQGNAQVTPIRTLADCKSKGSTSQKQQCFENLMDQTIKNQGLDRAFSLLDQVYADSGADCHQLAHTIGEKAYDLFAAHKDFALSPKSFYCGYGFYHGFMLTLLHKTNDMNQARVFCIYAGRKLHESSTDAAGACYHGIGHGAVSDVPAPNAWGDPFAIIAPALSLCEKVANTDEHLFRCASGAYNALEIMTSGNQYRLHLNTDDPFWICRKTADKYKKSCYSQMLIAALHVAQNNRDSTVKFIETIPQDQYAIVAMQSLIPEVVRQKAETFSDVIAFCHALPSRFTKTCIPSAALGYMKYGEPEKEYIKTFAFCSQTLLDFEEKQSCYSMVLSDLRVWYTHEKSQAICQSVPKVFQVNNCQYSA